MSGPVAQLGARFHGMGRGHRFDPDQVHQTTHFKSNNPPQAAPNHGHALLLTRKPFFSEGFSIRSDKLSLIAFK